MFAASTMAAASTTVFWAVMAAWTPGCARTAATTGDFAAVAKAALATSGFAPAKAVTIAFATAAWRASGVVLLRSLDAAAMAVAKVCASALASVCCAGVRAATAMLAAKVDAPMMETTATARNTTLTADDLRFILLFMSQFPFSLSPGALYLR